MELKNLRMSYNTELIFEDANLIIPDNAKVGVVGVNGAGKTTLFKIIMGIVKSDYGKVIIRNNYRVDWLPQIISDNIDNVNISVLDYLLLGRPIDKLNKELQEQYNLLGQKDSKQDKIFKKIEYIEKKLDYWEAYKAENILLKIIDGVNFSSELLSKKISELSGGQKSKVAFIRLIYSKPEIMLLDEPTNHLDEKSKEFIIEYLKKYHGMILIISHDIDFLNAVTNKTLFIDKRIKSIELYDGNYDKFCRIEKEKNNNLLRQAKIEEREEKKLRDLVNLYSNSSGKRKRMAQDREKKLEKLVKNKIEILDPNKTIKFKMNINRDSSNIPLKINNISFKYDKNSNVDIIHNLSLEIYKGEKFLIVGENGVGKSTLLKLIVGLLQREKGDIIISNKTDIAYYAQELELLDNDKSIIDNFGDTGLNNKYIRSVLGKFLFFNNDVFKKVGVLSPGERCRVALAKISISGANLLLLDEPTNHLDPDTENIIADVFKNYNGTMIVVSHNNAFVDNLGIERILILPNGKIEYYDKKIVSYYQLINKQ